MNPNRNAPRRTQDQIDANNMDLHLHRTGLTALNNFRKGGDQRWQQTGVMIQRARAFCRLIMHPDDVKKTEG